MYVYVYIYSVWVFFLSRTFANHRNAGEGVGDFFNSQLPLPPASQALRHLAGRLLAAGLEPGTFRFQTQVANHLTTRPKYLISKYLNI